LNNNGTLRELTVIQVADRLGVHSETVKRWHRDGKLKAKNKDGKLYITEYDLRNFLMKRKDTPEKIFQLFIPFREFKEKVIKLVEDFFGEDPGCVIALPPSGTPYALSLYFSLPINKDINFISLSETWDPILVENRKVLIVDDSIRTGGSINIIKEFLTSLKVKEIKVAVYDDFAGYADFSVRRQCYQEYLKSIKSFFKYD